MKHNNKEGNKRRLFWTVLTMRFWPLHIVNTNNKQQQHQPKFIYMYLRVQQRFCSRDSKSSDEF